MTGRARILVVEDTLANLELMVYLLEAHGHDVTTASNGHEALACVAERPPELIVCDIQLPQLDGHGVARALKSDPALRSIPLVAVTALAMVGDRDKILAAGFDGYISKPIEPLTFVAEIETYLGAGRQTVARAAHADRVQPPAASRVAGLVVLVVDNLAVNLDLARSILEPHGYSVQTASGMQNALATLSTLVPDVILSDVSMDDGTGFDFIAAVKSKPELTAIPFLFLTSTNVGSADRARGVALGAARYLERPIDAERLIAEIASAIAESRKDAP
jgi:two-component system cell cycle response regulator